MSHWCTQRFLDRHPVLQAITECANVDFMTLGPLHKAEGNPIYGKQLGLCFGCGKSAFNRPSVADDAVKKCLFVYPRLFAPFNDRHGLAIMCQKVIVSAVTLLLLRCRPTAVAWLVVSVVINAVDAVLGRWARSHIIPERLKYAPATAHSYAAPTIVSVLGMARTAASLPHFLPYFVLRNVFLAGRKQDRIGVSHERSPGTVCGENRQWGHNPLAFRFLYHPSFRKSSVVSPL